jgi:hypothetical protein
MTASPSPLAITSARPWLWILDVLAAAKLLVHLLEQFAADSRTRGAAHQPCNHNIDLLARWLLLELLEHVHRDAFSER